jgi:hypothetical protein
MGRKNEVVAAKVPHKGKGMTLHTVLTDYNRQMFIIICPMQPMFCSQSSGYALCVVFIYLFSHHHLLLTPH